MGLAALVLSLHSVFSVSGHPSDLLETWPALTWSTAPPWTETRILFDGGPLFLHQSDLLPPWASWRAVELLDPLQGGAWSNCGWSVNFVSPQVPDSSYSTGVGLLENTRYRNRYSGYLRRPLPAGLMLDVSAGREDTLSSQRLRLGWRSLGMTSQFWQGDVDAYTVHCGLTRPDFWLRAGFVHRGPGGRQYEILGQAPLLSGPVSVEMAGGAAYVDSVAYGEAHAVAEWGPGELSLVCRADGRILDEETIYGGAAGARWTRGMLSLGGGLWSPPGEREGLLLTAAVGPARLSTVIREKLSEITLAAYRSTRSLMMGLKARGWDDTLGVSALLLPSITYGNARIYAGGRMEAHLDHNSEWSAEGDILAIFHLGGFDFVGAVEDVQSDYQRRYTYGIVWEFVDRPPEPQEREGG